MILFPAIDIKNGSCVRLVQGKMENATVFNEDPIDQAKIFESKGCKWIHIVDLDGAIKGESVNQEVIKKIISSVNINNLQPFKNFTLKNVSYKYPRSSKDVLKNINISFHKGTSIGFIGSSGAGKTTLVDIILGLLTPTAGYLKYNQKPLN